MSGEGCAILTIADLVRFISLFARGAHDGPQSV
jgi:hypothetical protein